MCWRPIAPCRPTLRLPLLLLRLWLLHVLLMLSLPRLTPLLLLPMLLWPCSCEFGLPHGDELVPLRAVARRRGCCRRGRRGGALRRSRHVACHAQQAEQVVPLLVLVRLDGTA